MAKRKSTTKTKNPQLTPIQRFSPPAEGKYIVFDRETKDYALFLDAQYIGHASTRTEGEARLRDIVFEQLTHTESKVAVEQTVVIAVAEALADLPIAPVFTRAARRRRCKAAHRTAWAA